MPMVNSVAYATILLGFFAVCAAAANDAATGAAGVAASLTSSLRGALILAAVGFAFGLLVLDTMPWAALLDRLLPLSELPDNRQMLLVLMAAVGGVGVAVVLATWAGAPAPIGLLFFVSLSTLASTAGARVSVEGVLLVAGAALLALALAAVVTWLAVKAIIHAVLRHARPRDHLAPALPIAAAVTLALAGATGFLAFDWAAAASPPWPAGVAAVLVLGAIGGVGAHVALRRAPLRFTNDEAGAEAAFRRLQLGGATLVAAFHGAAQSLLLALPMALALRLAAGQRPRHWADLSLAASTPMVLMLVVLGATAVTFAGHRSTQLLADRLLPTAPIGGVAVNLGAQTGALAVLALGLPVAGNQLATGGFIGLAAALRPPASQVIGPAMRLVGGWLLGPVAAAVAGIGIYSIAWAWVG
ncbi:MAG: inorganic phosphate transporter [Roseomonas sp.]|nr:inorganic phosphate transporter [Roseomonas sp.]